MRESNIVIKKLLRVDNTIVFASQFKSIIDDDNENLLNTKIINVYDCIQLKSLTDIILNRINRCSIKNNVCNKSCIPELSLKSVMDLCGDKSFFKVNTLELEYRENLDSSQFYNFYIKSILNKNTSTMIRIVICY